jgi:hypothetical protein
MPYPEPLHSVRPISAPFGMALVLAPRPSFATLAELQIELIADAEKATTMVMPELEALRQSNPAARGLPLLEALAAGWMEPVKVDYIAGNWLAIAVRT